MKRKWAVLVVFAALAAPDVGAKDESEAGFDKGIKSIQSSFKQRSWKSARKKLSRLLEQHREQDYVRARLPLLRELAKECAFRIRFGEPKPSTLIKGQVKTYNQRTGNVIMRFESTQMDDWIKSGKFFVFPAVFDGPHTITVRGSAYPLESAASIVVCMDGDDAILVTPGLAPMSRHHRGIPAEISDLYKGRREFTTKRKMSTIDGGKKYEIAVVVERRAVHLKCDRRAHLKEVKDAKRWGRLGFGGMRDKGDRYPGFDEIVVTGQCKQWMQDLIDKEDQKLRLEFQLIYKEKEHLPAWLFEKTAKGANATGVANHDEWPIELDATTQVLADATRILVQVGKADEAIAALGDSDVLPEVVRHYLKAMAHSRLGRFRKALALFQMVRAAAPEFLAAIEGEALMHARLRETEKTIAVYTDLLKRYPGDAAIHVNWALILMREGRLTDADKLVKAAIARGVDSDNMQLVARLLQKSRHGPAFRRRFEHKTKHYHIVSDVDFSVCAEAGRYLEHMHAMYLKRLTRPKKNEGDQRFKVYLFSGQNGYLAYYKDLINRDARGSAGLYTPLLKQLLIWRPARKSDMMDTVRHEGFHQYLDRVLPNAPRWFNEGLAVYYETATMSIARMKVGKFREDCRESIESKGLVPLQKFFRLDDAAFMKDARLHYAQSWAIIHLLLQTDKEHKQLFQKLWDSYRDTPDHEEALAAALDAAALESLEADLKDLLRSGG